VRTTSAHNHPRAGLAFPRKRTPERHPLRRGGRRGSPELGAESRPPATRTTARPKPVELFPHEVGKSKVIAVRRREALFERRPVPLEHLKDNALVRRPGAVDGLSSRAPSKLSASRGPAGRAELDPVKEGRELASPARRPVPRRPAPAAPAAEGRPRRAGLSPMKRGGRRGAWLPRALPRLVAEGFYSS